MASRTFRITVRGAFADLTGEQRAELLAAAERAETAAKAWLETRGYGCRHLTSNGEDLSLS